jgi:hypothetical protein
MRVFTRRLAASIGASLLTACAGLALTATPASAADGVDLTVQIIGGKVAVGSESKAFIAKVTNAGNAKATGFDLDLAVDLDGVAVELTLPDELDEFCEEAGPNKAHCEFGNVLIPGDSLEIPIFVTPSSDETGGAGTLSATVASLDEPEGNQTNNKASTSITVTPAGVDIVVWAEDVTAGRDDDTGEAKRIAPGGTGDLVFALVNDGSAVARGLEMVLQLPEHVTFVETLEGCDVSADNRKMTCTNADVLLFPTEGDKWTLEVKVSATAPGPVELTGSIEGRAFGVGSQGSGRDRGPRMAGHAERVRPEGGRQLGQHRRVRGLRRRGAGRRRWRRWPAGHRAEGRCHRHGGSRRRRGRRGRAGRRPPPAHRPGQPVRVSGTQQQRWNGGLP